MPIFSKKRVGVNERLLLQLSSELEDKSSSTEGTGYSFIHPDDARAVLRREHVKDLFSSLSWYHEDGRTALWQNMCLILCILISMRWPDWGEFQNYFYYPGKGLKYPRYTDKHLPIKKEDFLETVPAAFSKRFLEHQYRFVPIFIKQNSHLKYSTDYRLPILKIEPLRDAEGAQGVVDKVIIERRFLYYRNDTFNHSPQVMACKRITAKTAAGQLNFDTEQRVLEQFKSCITNHDGIMQSFASFIHGSDFIILSPWADGRDLHLFLTQPDEVLNNYMARSIRFSPDNLLKECENLARALNFLHYEMLSPRGKRLKCAHLDLKPENVLVSFLPDERPNEAPVGRWKISDFGLSKVEEAVTEGRVIPVGDDDQEASRAPGNIARDVSFQPAARGAGAFQPPEVQSTGPVKVSTRRDVWSYGCILAMVLAFALGGPEEVKAQTRQRNVRGMDDFFYRRTHRRSRTPGPNGELMAQAVDAELKPPLRRWLDNAFKLAGDPHAQWIQWTSNLILTLLDVDVTTRPEILIAVDTLNSITSHTERLAAHRLWGFDDRSNLPEVVEPPQIHPQIDAPFVGSIDHSPPSSASYTEPRQRSPRRDSKRSSRGSGSIFYQVDDSLSFIRLATPHKCQGATIEPLGHVAALWNTAGAKLYNLSLLHADKNVWSEKPVKTPIDLDAFSMGGIFLPETSMCNKLQLAGQWLALLEQLTPSSFSLRLHYRKDQPQALYQARSSISLSQDPDDFKLSSYGTLAFKFRDRVELHTNGGFASIPLEKEFAGMAFTRVGEYFCLWERDRHQRGNTRTHNYWTVWSQDTKGAGGFKMIGQTIQLPLPPYVPEKPTGQVFLASFSTYPRFIACDRQQYVYIVRADLPTARAHLLGQTDNAVGGFVLPNDESFMLVRGPQEERQRAEQCLMSYAGSPSLQPKPSGKLYENIDIESDGAAVVSHDQFDDSPRLLTLKPTGLLVRKIL